MDLTEYGNHCAEHEARSMCIAGLKKDVESIKAERASRHQDMREEAQELWGTVKSKLSTATFTGSLGILIILFSSVMAAQWNLLLSISDKVNQIAETQAHFQGQIEAQERGKK